jgi:periplasmic protein TonB
MNSVKNFFHEFDLNRAIFLSLLIHLMFLINFATFLKKPIQPPPELQITFQKLENHVSETLPQPTQTPKPLEKKITPIIKKDAENPIPTQQKPIKEVETKPEEKKEATPTQANSDVKNAGEAALNDFSNILARHIAKFKMYPKIAQMRGWQGELVLEVKLNGDGALISSKIVKGSGFDVLDNEGLEMVNRASPFPVPPEILKGKSFSILVPIRFKLE